LQDVLLPGNDSAGQINVELSRREEPKSESGVNIDTDRAVASVIGASAGNIIG
jgi:hypothetical protein